MTWEKEKNSGGWEGGRRRHEERGEGRSDKNRGREEKVIGRQVGCGGVGVGGGRRARLGRNSDRGPFDLYNTV